MHFKEVTSAREKLPTSSGLFLLSLPGSYYYYFFLAFLSSGDNCYLFAGASCHPSTLTGQVAEARLCGAGQDMEVMSEAGEEAREGGGCQEI